MSPTDAGMSASKGALDVSKVLLDNMWDEHTHAQPLDSSGRRQRREAGRFCSPEARHGQTQRGYKIDWSSSDLHS